MLAEEITEGVDRSVAEPLTGAPAIPKRLQALDRRRRPPFCRSPALRLLPWSAGCSQGSASALWPPALATTERVTVGTLKRESLRNPV